MRRLIDRERLEGIMRGKGIDILVASSPENVYYSSDLPTFYTARNRLLYAVRNLSPCFCVFPVESEPKLVISASAVELARKHSWITDIRPYATGSYIWRPEVVTEFRRNPLDCLSAVIHEVKGGSVVALEQETMNARTYERLRRKLPNYEFTDASVIFEELRMIKTAEEIRRFRAATAALCKAMTKAFETIEQGVTEQGLLEVILSTMRKEGAESWHQTTVAFGPDNGPNIYNQPSDHKIRRGDFVRMDIGCVYDGYCADLSRVYAYRELPIAARELYAVLREAYELLLSKARPGVKASYLHSIAVGYVRKNYDEHYTRGNVGHGVGIELYDAPQLSQNDHRILEKGMTMSFEVPYHKYGLGGFNIEDSILVTNDGCEVVSDLPRVLLVAK